MMLRIKAILHRKSGKNPEQERYCDEHMLQVRSIFIVLCGNSRFQGGTVFCDWVVLCVRYGFFLRLKLYLTGITQNTRIFLIWEKEEKDRSRNMI